MHSLRPPTFAVSNSCPRDDEMASLAISIPPYIPADLNVKALRSRKSSSFASITIWASTGLPAYRRRHYFWVRHEVISTVRCFTSLRSRRLRYTRGGSRNTMAVNNTPKVNNKNGLQLGNSLAFGKYRLGKHIALRQGYEPLPRWLSPQTGYITRIGHGYWILEPRD